MSVHCHHADWKWEGGRMGHRIQSDGLQLLYGERISQSSYHGQLIMRLNNDRVSFSRRSHDRSSTLRWSSWPSCGLRLQLVRRNLLPLYVLRLWPAEGKFHNVGCEPLIGARNGDKDVLLLQEFGLSSEDTWALFGFLRYRGPPVDIQWGRFGALWDQRHPKLWLSWGKEKIGHSKL